MGDFNNEVSYLRISFIDIWDTRLKVRDLSTNYSRIEMNYVHSNSLYENSKKNRHGGVHAYCFIQLIVAIVLHKRQFLLRALALSRCRLTRSTNSGGGTHQLRSCMSADRRL